MYDRKKLIAMVGFCLPFLITAVLLRIGISTIYVLIISIVIPLIIVGYMLKPVRQPPSAAPTQTAGTRSRKYGGLIVAIVLLAVVVAIVMWANSLEAVGKTISAQDLMNGKKFGDCKIERNSFMCDGPWSVTLTGNEKIKGVRFYQALGSYQLTESFNVTSGAYRIELFEGEYTCVLNRPLGQPVYKAAIYYYNETDYTCIAGSDLAAPTEANDRKQEPPIFIGEEWYNKAGEGDLGVYIGSKKITRSTVIADPKFIFGFPLELSYTAAGKTGIEKMEVILSK